MPYFARGPLAFDDPSGYANPTAVLKSARTYERMHPLGEIVTALIEAGLTPHFPREHDAAGLSRCVSCRSRKACRRFA